MRIYTQSLLAAGIVVSLALCSAFFIYQDGSLFSAIFLGRLLVCAAMLYFFYEKKKNELMYYRNLGLSKRKILGGLAVIDMVLSLIFIYTCYAIIA